MVPNLNSPEVVWVLLLLFSHTHVRPFAAVCNSCRASGCSFTKTLLNEKTHQQRDWLKTPTQRPNHKTIICTNLPMRTLRSPCILIKAVTNCMGITAYVNMMEADRRSQGPTLLCCTWYIADSMSLRLDTTMFISHDADATSVVKTMLPATSLVRPSCCTAAQAAALWPLGSCCPN